MNREDIIRMAREAGLHLYVNDLTEEPYALIVERFANLVAAAEREAIAQMFDDPPPLEPDVQNKRGGCLICGFTPAVAAKAIRARGQR